jgi:hypothetical protein
LLAYRLASLRRTETPQPIDNRNEKLAVETDREAKVAFNLAKLGPEDQRLAKSQSLCAAQGCDNQLGADGPPVRVVVDSKHLFCCGPECERWVLAHPREALARVSRLEQTHSHANVHP